MGDTTSKLSFVENQDNEEGIDELMISSLPRVKAWGIDDGMYNYQGFWYHETFLRGLLIARNNFNPKPNDVVLASYPRCGTTWMITLLFTTINRARYNNFSTHPLLTSSPQDDYYSTWLERDMQRIDPTNDKPKSPIVSSYLLIKMHIPYTSLPKSIACSKTPIVYVYCDPMDIFVSLWHFVNKIRVTRENLSPLGIEETFDMFCQGVSHFGPYWDHVLGYWNASLEMPDKVFFLRYEDMKKNPNELMKKLSKFLGCSFSYEEEVDGVIDKIVELCSFDKLTSLQQTIVEFDESRARVTDNLYFTKGKIGDHKNYLTSDMIKQLKDVVDMKFRGSGLDVYA